MAKKHSPFLRLMRLEIRHNPNFKLSLPTPKHQQNSPFRQLLSSMSTPNVLSADGVSTSLVTATLSEAISDVSEVSIEATVGHLSDLQLVMSGTNPDTTTITATYTSGLSPGEVTRAPRGGTTPISIGAAADGAQTCPGSRPHRR